MTRIRPECWLAIALVWLAGTAQAFPPPYETGAGADGARITVYSEYLRDPEGELTFSDVHGGEFDERFTPATGELTNKGFSRDTWWVRFALRNTSRDHDRFLLELFPGVFSAVAFIEPGDDGPEVRHSGTREDPPWGDIRYRNQLFHVDLEPGDSGLYYLRLEPRHSFVYGLSLHGPGQPPGGNLFVDHLYLLLAGILIGLMLFNLGTFILYGGKAYLHYAIFLAAITLAALANAGFIGMQYLAGPGRQPVVEQAAVFLVIYSGLAFSRNFLGTPVHAPRLNRALLLCMGLALTGLLLSLLLPATALMSFAFVLAMAGLLLLIWLSVRAWRSRLPQAGLHLVARLPLVTAGVLLAMLMTGLWSPVPQAGLILLAAGNMEALLFAIGLSRKSRAELEKTMEEVRQHSVWEAIHETRRDTLSRLSHEIRTPMSGILGMAEILRDTPLSPNQRECVHAIQISGESLLQLLNDVLEHARLEEDSTELDIRPVALDAVLMDAIELFRERAEERQIELITHVHTNIPARLETDPTRLKQLITSILGPCIRHAQPGELVLDVARDVSGRPDHYSFEFEGSALATLKEEHLHALLTEQEPQDHDSTSLALSIAHHLIRLMKGQAGLRHGKHGPVVQVTLPLLTCSDLGVESTAGHEELLSGKRMLVVDDSSTFTRVVWQQALSWGMRVTTYQDPREALASIRTQVNLSEPYDVVVLDQNMPGMDGIQLAQRIREDERISPGPVLIMLTGVRSAPTAAMAHRAGIRRILGKPVSGSRLRQVLAEELGSASPAPDDQIAPPGRPRPGLRVLVAEDHELSRKVIAGMLRKLNLDPVVVHDGRQAVEAWRRENFDLILMDCEMPEMDGFEATRMIRDEERRSERQPVPILALTAHIMREHRDRSRKAGMNDHVPKPVDMNVLQEAIARFTDAGTPPDSRPASDETPG